MRNIMLSPNSLDSFGMLFRAYTMLYALRWLNWTLYGFMDSNQFMAYDGKQKSRRRSIQKYLKGIGYGPFPLTTTRVMTFLVGNTFILPLAYWEGAIPPKIDEWNTPNSKLHMGEVPLSNLVVITCLTRHISLSLQIGNGMGRLSFPRDRIFCQSQHFRVHLCQTIEMAVRFESFGKYEVIPTGFI